MKVLVACEESQEVCKAFRKLGHWAFSCDLVECSGGHPEWHIIEDVSHVLNGYCHFVTSDGYYHYVSNWDLIIAHPPCTYLTITGNRWFNVERYGFKALDRIKRRNEAVDFFMTFVDADCPRIAIENPVGFMSSIYRKPDQIIQPYFFGHPARKSTCLWLKGLPLLRPTHIVTPDVITFKNGRTDDPWHFNSISLPPADRSRFRSKTFSGIASAMADQWS